ncbi:hypothetical protein [Brachybacterium nesterenkovii]|uniref:hypothetical protein n=1 Tax=Brachybacterium nesterenkovii TaxID=47847 RepID=UPI00321A1BEF
MLRVWMKQKRVWVPAVALAVLVALMIGLAIIGRFSNVPEEEKIAVKPSASPSVVQGANDPTPVDAGIVPLPSTDQPQELAQSVAQVLGSPDTARFTEEDYIATIETAAPEIVEDTGTTSPREVAESVVKTAWAEDPWADCAQLKGTDKFTATKVTSVDSAVFLEKLVPAGQGSNDKAREYMQSHGLTVMQVDGTLLREWTDQNSGERLQKDAGETSWTIGMLSEPGAPCKVFFAQPGTLRGGTDG